MYKLYCIILFLSISFFSCQSKKRQEKKKYDFTQMQDSGKLTIITQNSSTSYFMYRGEKKGFQYELANKFAEDFGLKLNIIVAKSSEEMVNLLKEGKGDLIAYHLPFVNEWKDDITYCGKEMVTHQVIIQRNKRRKSLKDVTELIGKEIYARDEKYITRLTNLNAELGGGIIIKEMPQDSLSTEDLIAQVAKGKIKYTIADNDIAKLNKTYYPNLNVNLSVSYDQRSSWAVRKECEELAHAIDKWMLKNKTSTTYHASLKRYFEQSKQKMHIPVLSAEKGRISIYDSLFKTYAKQLGWDWKLLASLAYQESHFDTTAISWAGARGLMQLMPRTARAMGVPRGKEFNAEENIKAAVKYIKTVERSLRRINDKEERTKFLLAAYNAGLGHVYDAMALAKKYNYKDSIWKDNVAKFILLKSNEKYYRDPVCKNGYFRGRETYNFVYEIIERYEGYNTKIKSEE